MLRVAFAVLFLFPKIAFCAGDIKVFFDNGSRPFMNGDGSEVKGIYPELVKVIFKKAEIPLVVDGVPWKRALESSEAGDGWAGGIVKTPDREKIYAFSDAIFREKVVAFTVKGGKVKKNIKGMTDLRGLTVGSNRGWSHGGDWDQLVKAGAFNLQESENATSNIKRLLDGGIDVYITVREDGVYAARDIGAIDKIDVGKHVLTENSTHLAIGKKVASEVLLTKINAAIKELGRTGELSKAAGKALQ